MRPKPDQPLAKKTLKVWKIVTAMSSLLLSFFPGAYWGARLIFDLPIWPFYLIVSFILLVAIINIFIIQKLQWSRWRYKIYENEIELMHGVFVVRRVIIPMIRVQHVDTKQGPLLRHYDLATVTVSTAATTHEIPGLTMGNADSLRDHIAQLAREADTDDE
jgi:membrane protein YdbS with pleckstrin-like domain